MAEIDVAHHEAGHAIAAFVLKVPVQLLSIRPADGEAGRCRLDSSAIGSDLDAAIILVAGKLAEQKALGRLQRFDWFAEVGEDDREDTDDGKARHFADRLAADGCFEGDVREARHWIEFRARALISTRWETVMKVAAELERKTVLTGDEVSRICLADDARRSARRAARSRQASPSPHGVERRPFEYRVKGDAS